MPDQGRLTEPRLPHTTPAVAPLYAPPPWKLPGARVLKVMYETDAEPLLAWLPARLTRSSPPYAIITVAEYPETPIGPFSLAAQYLGCRAGFFIRALTLQAVTGSAAAMAALREVWGYPCAPGAINLSSDGTAATVEADGGLLTSIELHQLEPVEAALVRFDPVLNLRLFPSLEEDKRHDLVQLVQIDPDYAVNTAGRGLGRVEFPAAESPWCVLPVRNVISAAYCEMDTELPLARFVTPY
ncbi:MAG TPA: acetoacetate decarboxylase family protein [Dehalococcoidia bacterium]|nr:acetoacetate decarboxylase family protein [Dehalococcoidia bacterium]